MLFLFLGFSYGNSQGLSISDLISYIARNDPNPFQPAIAQFISCLNQGNSCGYCDSVVTDFCRNNYTNFFFKLRCLQQTTRLTNQCPRLLQLLSLINQPPIKPPIEPPIPNVIDPPSNLRGDMYDRCVNRVNNEINSNIRRWCPRNALSSCSFRFWPYNSLAECVAARRLLCESNWEDQRRIRLQDCDRRYNS